MRTLIKGATIINEMNSFEGDILIDGDTFSDIGTVSDLQADEIMDASGMILIPGVIDDQVHFRQPGATYKGNIASESIAGVLGGVTSYMDMPNNNPPTISLELLENKYEMASRESVSNYSFYMGASNDNISEIRNLNPKEVCGVKLFMGSSTGNMLVDDDLALEAIFKDAPCLIATHCEEESVIRSNLEKVKTRFSNGEDWEIPYREHPFIRSREACITSTKKALSLALKYNSRLHILHVSTKEELQLIREAKLKNPNISCEVCVHYMWFNSRDYDRMGSFVKCNPAIKDYEDMLAIREAVRDGIADVVATDHAPHLLEEKMKGYLSAPSGLPLLEHSLRMMLQLSDMGAFTKEQVVNSMCHAPAKYFKVKRRGFIREGYFADFVLINPSAPADRKIVSKENIHYKCGWSPLEGEELRYVVEHTFINGIQVVKNGQFTGAKAAQRILFDR